MKLQVNQKVKQKVNRTVPGSESKIIKSISRSIGKVITIETSETGSN